MVVRPEYQAMQMLLTEAITTLCKNGLKYRSHFNVEGLLGITLDDEDVFLISIKDTVKDGTAASKAASIKKSAGDTSPMSRAKQRKRRKRSTDSVERLTPTSIPLNNNNTEKKNSNVPYDVKPVDWNDVKEARENNKQQPDYFDDSASSPGELIVVKEENLSEVERVQIENQCSQKEKSSHSGPTTTNHTASNAQESQDSKNSHANNAAIYASSNGQMIVPRRSPFQAAWESPYAAPADAQNGFGQDDGSFSQQEPDDTACLKAAYADVPSGNTDALNSTASGPVFTSTPAAGANRRKRTLDSVVKNLITKKQFGHEDTENAASPLSIDMSAGYITTKNINNNNVTIDTSTGLEVKPPRRKGPFGKKRLTEIADVNNHVPISDSSSDISMNSSIGTPGSDATCHICNKVLSTKASYKRHMNFHQGIYPHRCSICGKGFAVKGDLRGHEATHTNEKEFPCTGCDRVFAYKKNLQMHMRKKHQHLLDEMAASGWSKKEAIMAGGELAYGFAS